MHARTASIACSIGLAAGWTQAVSTADAGANRFGSALYGALAEHAPGNFVVSPFSVHAALSMVAAGAAGDTESQLVGALALPSPRAARDTALRAVRGRLDAACAKGDVTLEVANRVWVQRSYPLLPDFTQGVEQIFGAGFAGADFAGNAEGCRQEINGWVVQRTHDRIRDLIPAGVLNPLTRMVLVNAVYFHGTWQTPFLAARTQPLPFHVAPDCAVDAPLMQGRLKELGYREEEGLQVCELPYKGRELAMVVLLPVAGGLPRLERRLAEEGIDAVCGSLAPQDVEVALPRFRMEGGFSLPQTLAGMGIRDAFEAGRADFSRMTGNRELFVSAVLHKAFIEVNEKGTEAAGATAVVVGRAMAMPPHKPVIFRADRPFVFILRDRVSGLVLFMGRVADPTAK